jgi:hypothetical protein
MEIDGFRLKTVDSLGFEICHIPEDDKERLAFYDKLFYEAYQKNRRLKIWNVGIGMCSSVEGDYCLLCKVKMVKHVRDKVKRKP